MHPAPAAVFAALGLALALVWAAPSRAASIFDLQKAREVEVVGHARLQNLNPGINVWYFLELTVPGGKASFNLTNSAPSLRRIHLDPEFHEGVRIDEAGASVFCELWNAKGDGPLVAARAKHAPYVSLCGGKITLKSVAQGRESFNEWCTDFLRLHVPGGESVITMVKNTIFSDKEMITADTAANPTESEAASKPGKPMDALVARAFNGATLPTGKLAIRMKERDGKPMGIGRWYEAALEPGVYVSQIEPRFVAPEVLTSFPARVGALSAVEEKAISYLVAFDLSRFSLGYTLGTKHPGVEWSRRSPDFRKLARSSAGPDGFGSVKPLAVNGIVGPEFLSRAVATFTGGFKRYHSAFKTGPFSEKNKGSHYGFVEDGVVFSKLVPGLSTMAADADGKISMRTWREGDAKKLDSIRYARQNGVPIVVPLEPKEAKLFGGRLVSKPGLYVDQWGQGNWSGDVKSKKRTLRTGACMQEEGGKQFLIFGYFSSATPSSMARVFQAYRCEYAMHLDMNALEHTYMALFKRNGDDYKIEHLSRGMGVFDHKDGDKLRPRFVGEPDSRDFFFLYRR